MSNNVLKLLRYNTGNDKKAFIKFKNDFDAVIFNATIVAHSGSAVADLVSVHKNQYIIDPQTHIFQHNIDAIQSQKTKEIKKSIANYLKMLPDRLSSIIIKQNRSLTQQDVIPLIKELTESVYLFETEYVNKYIKTKAYDKYLKYAKVGPEPKTIIAPYFMLKNEYSDAENMAWLDINKKSLQSFIKLNNNKYGIAAQLVIDKDVLRNPILIEHMKNDYDIEGYDYIFIWIDDFCSFTASKSEKQSFKELLVKINSIGKKVVMAYGGYDSIFLCNNEVESRIYGVAQSVGYGEARPIIPVGGGLPVNKYYFHPIHQRIRFDEAAKILTDNGYFSKQKSNAEYAKDYYQFICDCKQCKSVIKNDINNFKAYNESTPYIINSRYGEISRNRPTQDAILISAMHFLFCKVEEWQNVLSYSLPQLKDDLLLNFTQYRNSISPDDIKEWCDIFAG